MRMPSRAAAAALALLLPVPAALAADRCVLSGHDLWPPFSHATPDGGISGASVEIVRRAMEEAGLEVDAVYGGPWKRVLAGLEAGGVDAVAAVFSNPERAARYRLSVPYHTLDIVAFVPAGSPFSFRTWEELRGRTAIIAAGSSYGAAWDGFARDNLQVITAPSATEVVRMLLGGRGDFAVGPREPGLLAAREAGLDGRLRALDPPLLSLPIHAALNREGACGQAADRVDEALTRLRASGEVARIVARHMAAEAMLPKP